jgi:ankyrin repeat protein
MDYSQDIKTPIENKLNPNISDSKGNTAMHFAAFNDNCDAVVFLYERLNADPLLPNHYNEKPIDVSPRNS